MTLTHHLRRGFCSKRTKQPQEVVKNLIEIYKNERIDDETFENFDTRVLSNLTVGEIQSKIGL